MTIRSELSSQRQYIYADERLAVLDDQRFAALSEIIDGLLDVTMQYVTRQCSEVAFAFAAGRFTGRISTLVVGTLDNSTDRSDD